MTTMNAAQRKYATGSKEVTLVDNSGKPTGRAPILDAHRHPAQLHAAISVFLFRKQSQNNKIQLLVQQRSTEKIVGADLWGNTVCGNVAPDEKPLECAKRRLHQELGIPKDQLPQLILGTEIEYKVFSNEIFGEHEYDFCYFGWVPSNISVNPNPNEVAAAGWVNWAELKIVLDQLAAKPPLASETLKYETAELHGKTIPLKLDLAISKIGENNSQDVKKQNYTFCQWSSLFLCEPQVRNALNQFLTTKKT